jgi:DNA-binding transcriptional ArsR family regulator
MELGRSDLNLLIILEGLLQEHSITRVAERLELSQPTVSAALGRLRAVLNDELFVRSHCPRRTANDCRQTEVPMGYSRPAGHAPRTVC